ncbi:MAG: glycosyltransferase family 2 protein [Candidatus Nealsonbacteria bacterium]
MPKVSVITPLYNSKKYIEKAIKSVLNQTYKDFESIIIDDGSTDGSGELVKDKFGDKVKYVYQENKGAAAAVNKGISLSQGDYIAFCDSDDWWLPEKLEKQVKFLEANQNFGLVYSDAFLAKDGILTRKTWLQSRKVLPCSGGKEKCLVSLFSKNFIPAPLTILIKKSVIDRVGLFNENFSSTYDYEYWFRNLEVGIPIAFLDEPLVVWNSRVGQGSRRIRKMKWAQIKILREFLIRNPKFIKDHPLLVTSKFIKSYLGLLLGKTSLKNENRN